MKRTFYEILASQGIPMDGFIDMLYDDHLKGALSKSMYDEYGFETPFDYFQSIVPTEWITEAFELHLTPQGEKFWKFVDSFWKHQVATHWGTITDGILYLEPVTFDDNGCAPILGGCIKEKRFYKKVGLYKE